MVQKKGNSVPSRQSEARQEYADAISQALKRELGESARAAKIVMRWTGGSERTAKYWLSGTKTPSGWQLVMLLRHSDAILHEILRLSGRDLLSVSIELDAAEIALGRASAIVSALRKARH